MFYCSVDKAISSNYFSTTSTLMPNAYNATHIDEEYPVINYASTSALFLVVWYNYLLLQQ